VTPEEEQEFRHRVLKEATDDLLTVGMERSHEFVRGVAWAVDRIHERAGMENMNITGWLHRILDSHGDNDVEPTEQEEEEEEN
jgi:hypothetical protein